jgi:hypothetical protein
MNCKKPFDDEFMFKHLNKSYCKTEFKEHRRKILFDTEVSKIPETMGAVENLLRAEEIEQLNVGIRDKIMELEIEINKHRREINENGRVMDDLRRRKRGGEKREFIMPCPNNDCRGFLSTAYKCEICKFFTCPQCLELIGLDRGAEHVCNPDCVKNAEAIKKDTRPCPSCGSRIYKIEGCSQIWCTSCHVAFDWNTGRIDNGVIHNPHFFEWQRQGGVAAGGGAGAGAAGAGACDANRAQHVWFGNRRQIISYMDTCEISVNRYSINRLVSVETSEIKKIIVAIRAHVTSINNLSRVVEHFAQESTVTRHRIQHLENHDDMRIMYILKRISEEYFMTEIYKKSVLKKRLLEKYHIYELIMNVGREFFVTLTSHEIMRQCIAENEIKTLSTEKNVEFLQKFQLFLEEKEKEMVQFCEYCNSQFQRIGKLYEERVYVIKTKETKEHKIFDYSLQHVIPARVATAACATTENGELAL